MSSSMFTYQLPWLQTPILFIFSTIFYTAMVSCSKINIPYSDHCASFVAESKPTDPETTIIPFPPDQRGFFLGGDGLLNHSLSNTSQYYYYSSSNRKTLLFRTHNVHKTDDEGIYKVEASLILETSDVYYYMQEVTYSYSYSPQIIYNSGSQMGRSNFEVEGFWSVSTGKLCMVGSSYSYSPDGKKGHAIPALLKLTDVKVSSSITSLVSGTLESLSFAGDSDHFNPISLLMFPQMNYKYTKVSNEFNYGCPGGIDVAKNLSLSLPLSYPACSMFSRSFNSFELEYASDCNSSKSCNPLGESLGYPPRVMSMSLIQCSDDKQSLRFLVDFPNGSYVYDDRPFTPNTTLVAEGSWDAKKNQMCIAACQISGANNSFDATHVNDCSIRLSLRFPAVWSMGNTNRIVGQMWSNKAANAPGYFNRIMLRSSDNYRRGMPGVKYEYTLVDKAKKSCRAKMTKNSSNQKQYPDGYSSDMQFVMSFKTPKAGIQKGYANTVFVGDQMALWHGSVTEEIRSQSSPVNISYQMSLSSFNSSANEYTQINAEGIYDAETGVLCMVGCKYLNLSERALTNDSVDCEILIHVQFPPLNSNKEIEGRIESMRKESTHLHFGPLLFTAVPFYHHTESIWRMDLEIFMALIFNTLVCIFVGCQILHVKKHPKAFPFISLVMLVVLTLGHMIPLLLNFEALFFPKQNLQSSLLRSGGWLEVNEVIVRLVTMVAFLLQCRLLQLVWSARLAEKGKKASWVAEKKTLYVSLPLYIAGGLIALSLNWKNYKHGEQMHSRYSYASTYSYGFNRHEHSLWVDLRSYAGLIQDSFLFPQIILNIFQNSKEKALSHFFYLGTTFVRLLPHAYDLYRAHRYVQEFEGSYIYANHDADFFSTAWDVVIPAGCLLFAAILYLQQRLGGRCFFPRRFKELQSYEKLPSVATDA